MESLLHGAKKAGGALALLVLGCIVVPGAALAQPAAPAQQPAPDLSTEFDHAFVFGDSLSDDGNVYAATNGATPTSPPYALGRFSNGPIWVDHVVNGLEPVFVDPTAFNRDFAAGGARTDATFDQANLVPPGVLAQLQIFQDNLAATQTSVGANDLITLWAGANNIFDAFRYIGANPAQFPDQATAQAFLLTTSDSAVTDIHTAVQALIGSGAKKILVANLPNLGEIPRFNRDPLLSAAASLASERFNQGLSTSLSTLSASTGGGVDIISMDIDKLYQLIRSRPAEFGLENVNDPCINQVSIVDPSTLTICSSDPAQQNKYVFWDEIHPTSAVHELIARTAIGLLTADQAFETPMTFSETSLIAARALSHDVSQRLTEVRALTPVPANSAPSLDTSTQSADGRLALFLSGSYGFGDRNPTGPIRGFNYDLHTITFGANARLGNTAVAGLAVGYAKSQNDLTDGSRFNVTAWQGTAFATYFRRRFYVDGSLTYGQLDFRNYVRPTMLAPIKAKGQTNGRYWVATGNAGYVCKAGNFVLSLDGGLRYIDAHIDGFTEEEAPILGLTINAQKTTSLTALASAEVSRVFHAHSWKIVPYSRATYEAELDGVRIGSGRLIDNTANPILVHDHLLKDDIVQINAGLLIARNNLLISIDYLNRLGIRNDGEDQQVSARLTWSF